MDLLPQEDIARRGRVSRNCFKDQRDKVLSKGNLVQDHGIFQIATDNTYLMRLSEEYKEPYIHRHECKPMRKGFFTSKWSALDKWWHTDLKKHMTSNIWEQNYNLEVLGHEKKKPSFMGGSRNLKGGIRSQVDPCVNAMGQRPYWPSRMEVGYCTFGFGAIIQRDLCT